MKRRLDFGPGMDHETLCRFGQVRLQGLVKRFGFVGHDRMQKDQGLIQEMNQQRLFDGARFGVLTGKSHFRNFQIPITKGAPQELIKGP